MPAFNYSSPYERTSGWVLCVDGISPLTEIRRMGGNPSQSSGIRLRPDPAATGTQSSALALPGHRAGWAA
jgi:hypothetical protein